jgi:hypothetical protein
MGVKEFHWRDEGRSLGADLEQLDSLESDFRKLAKSDAYHIVLGHSPASKAKPGIALPISVTYVTQTGNPKVVLFYRNSRQRGYTKVVLKLQNEFERKWIGEIPSQEMTPGFVEYYFEAVAEPWGPYGGTLANQKPYLVLVNDNYAKPTISLTAPQFQAGDEQVAVNVHVEAKSKTSSVRAYYKPMPASYEWTSVELQANGEGNYIGSLPVTSEGLLYYFEAVDVDGNGANYPNFMEQSPYFSVNGWSPGK